MILNILNTYGQEKLIVIILEDIIICIMDMMKIQDILLEEG